MNYIIFDLEYNQKHPNDTDNQKKSLLQFEIIQIGAIKLSENFDTLENFNSIIKPVVHTSIHPYVENLTKITDLDINSSVTFPQVYNDFLNFIGDSPYCFGVWGLNDIKELIKNITFHKLSLDNLSLHYIDIQNHTSKYFSIPKGRKISLQNAVTEFGLNLTGDFHDAFFDAYYTAEIFKLIYNDNIKLEKYCLNNEIQKTKPIPKTDTSALLKQLEKMFNKTLTPLEVKMVKTAYNMGKTKQFIKKS